MPLPDEAAIIALHKKYAPNDKVFELVFTHCQIVSEIAQWCADRLDQAVDRDLLRAACLLHDVGTYPLFDDDAETHNDKYPLHAIFGAKIVLDEGFDPRISSLIETHLLLGLSKQEIVDRPWPLPARDYLPDSLEGELLCYADRFHSKQPVFNSYDTFLAGLQKNLPRQAAKFEAAAQRFGVPDIAALAAKYRHPVR